MTAKTPVAGGTPPGGLAALDEVVLPPARESLLAEVSADATGHGSWKARKRAEARSLLALAEIAPRGRFRIHYLDLRVELRAVVRLDVPVPTLTDVEQGLVIERGATLGIRYPEEALTRPLPGYEFVEIMQPARVWHANASRRSGQRLCLGASLPALVPLKEIVLASYGALAMQSVQVDARDPAGVMNHEAAVWWSQNLDRTPLTTTPFLGRG